MSEERVIRVIQHGGTGKHLIHRVYVNSTAWAEVRFSGRDWVIYDLQGHSYDRARSHADAVDKLRLLILDNSFPDPETAWRNAVGRLMRQKMEAAMTMCAPDLFAAMMRFIAAVKDDPTFAKHPAFQVVSAQVEAIIDTTVNDFKRQRDRAMDGARTAHNVPLEQFGYPTRGENQRALDSFVKKSHDLMEDADRRLRFAKEIAEEMKTPLRPLHREKKAVAA